VFLLTHLETGTAIKYFLIFFPSQAVKMRNSDNRLREAMRSVFSFSVATHGYLEKEENWL